MADVRKLLGSLLLSLLFFTISGQSPNLTSTSDIVCFGEQATLTCSAENFVRWSSDIIGGTPIEFLRQADSPGAITTRGNATAEYLRVEGTTVISSLRFNATSDVSVINCRDNGDNSMSKNITVSSRPSNDSSIMDRSVDNNNAVRIVTWEKPSNHEDFILESYVVTLRNSNGDNIVDGPTSLPPNTQSIRYDELQTGNYSFNLTVINSCGDVASIVYEFQVLESATGEQSDDDPSIPTWVYVAAPILLVIIIVVVVIVVVMICFFKGKNKETKGPGLRNSVQMEGK